MLRLAARYADAWNGGLTSGRAFPDAVPPLQAAVDAACVAVGRDPATLERTVGVLVEFSDRSTARTARMTAPVVAKAASQPMLGGAESRGIG